MAGTDPPPNRDVPVARSLLSPAGLARVLEATHGLAAVRCRLIKGTIRDTYRVTSRDADFVLSVYRHGHRTLAEITAELDVLELLSANGVGVAPAVPQRTGERVFALRAPEGVRWAVLFTFVPGRHLDRRPEPSLAHAYGRAIGRMHGLADAFGSRLDRPSIDVAHLLDRPLAAFADVVTHRPADVEELRQVAASLRPRIAALPTAPPAFGLVHGDVIPSNAQVTPDGDVALLDFDFCGHGWRAYDLATYLSEVRYWDAGPAVAAAFLQGYEDIRPLLDWERSALPLFEAARHLFSLGVPAQHVDEWGSAYLSDGMIDTLLAIIRECLAEV